MGGRRFSKRAVEKAVADTWRAAADIAAQEAQLQRRRATPRSRAVAKALERLATAFERYATVRDGQSPAELAGERVPRFEATLRRMLGQPPVLRLVK